ncbi:hypothetical protein [Luteimonas sp. MC1572]|uniref:hypothetical protein n=1 Tax=Luteimonas sp. MC1572 TaxID=2799325 RepID=UPI001F279886|nr:hypothetical protein [Luteimonas sp. MC1572]
MTIVARSATRRPGLFGLRFRGGTRFTCSGARGLARVEFGAADAAIAITVESFDAASEAHARTVSTTRVVAVAAALRTLAGIGRFGAVGLRLGAARRSVGLRAGDGRRAQGSDGEGGSEKQGMTLHA